MTDKVYEKRVNKASIIISFILTFLFISYHYGHLEIVIYRIVQELLPTWFFLKAFLLIVCFIGLFVALKDLFNVLFSTALHQNHSEAPVASINRKHFYFFFGLSIISKLPYFLSFYPGLLSPDSVVQINEMVGILSLSNRHPALHTLLVKIFVNTGLSLFGSVQAGVAFWIAFQVIIMSLVASYAITFIKSIDSRGILSFVSVLFYLVLPINSFYAITLWKDIMYAAFVTTFTIIMWKLFEQMQSDKKISIAQLAFLSFLAFGMCTMKSNGHFIFLIIIPFIVFSFKKQKLSLGLASIVPLILALILHGPVYQQLGVEGSDTVEKISLPLQQVARVIWDGNPLNSEEQQLIESIVDLYELEAVYTPEISDPVKELVRRSGQASVLDDFYSDYSRMYFELGLRHPVSYFNAWLDLTRGYLEPMLYWVVAIFDHGNGLTSNTVGLTREKLLGVPFNDFLMDFSRLFRAFPMTSLLYTIGFYFLAMLFVFALSWIRKTTLIHFIPHISLLLGLLLFTPVFSEFRYGYPTVLSLPVLLATSLYGGSKATTTKSDHSQNME